MTENSADHDIDDLLLECDSDSEDLSTSTRGDNEADDGEIGEFDDEEDSDNGATAADDGQPVMCIKQNIILKCKPTCASHHSIPILM